jgi:hypothetical protein
MNLQVIATPAEDIVWVSGPLPGSVHGMKAAWIWGIERELAAAGRVALADKGCQGQGKFLSDMKSKQRQPRLMQAHPPTL